MNLCLSGDYCAEEAVESTAFPGQFKFCQKHQDALDASREHLHMRNFKNKAKNYKGEELDRYCTSPGCAGRPVYGGDYCHDCNGDD